MHFYRLLFINTQKKRIFPPDFFGNVWKEKSLTPSNGSDDLNLHCQENGKRKITENGTIKIKKLNSLVRAKSHRGFACEVIPEEEENRKEFFRNSRKNRINADNNNNHYIQTEISDTSEDVSNNNNEPSTSGSYSGNCNRDSEKSKKFTFDPIDTGYLDIPTASNEALAQTAHFNSLLNNNTSNHEASHDEKIWPIPQISVFSPRNQPLIINNKNKSNIYREIGHSPLPSITPTTVSDRMNKNKNNVNLQLTDIFDNVAQSFYDDPEVKKKIESLVQNIEDIKKVLKKKMRDRECNVQTAKLQEKTNSKFNLNTKKKSEVPVAVLNTIGQRIVDQTQANDVKKKNIICENEKKNKRMNSVRKPMKDGERKEKYGPVKVYSKIKC